MVPEESCAGCPAGGLRVPRPAQYGGRAAQEHIRVAARERVAGAFACLGAFGDITHGRSGCGEDGALLVYGCGI